MRDFNHSVSVLVTAYLNGTLQNMNCYACAVGNLVADACGYKFVNITPEGNERITVAWLNERYPVDGWYGIVVRGRRSTSATYQVKATGYSVEELGKIEEVFENKCHINGDDESTFKSLMAVVDVLAEIHGVNLEAKENAKSLFVKV